MINQLLKIFFTPLDICPIIPVKEPFSISNPHWPSGGCITSYLKLQINFSVWHNYNIYSHVLVIYIHHKQKHTYLNPNLLAKMSIISKNIPEYVVTLVSLLKFFIVYGAYFKKELMHIKSMKNIHISLS